MIEPDLNDIARHLEGLEETIISRLIDRAQFKRNAVAYQPGLSGFEGEPELSLFSIRMRYQEEMDARFGRFQVAEERPFNRNLPQPGRKVQLPKNCLMLPDYDRVNLTDRILAAYLELVPGMCRPGDDAQYGSSVEHDVHAIQAISRRIHYGAMYVAESKYRSDPSVYRSAAAAGDPDRLNTLLTRPEVERRILVRVHVKAAMIQASARADTRVTIHPDVIRDFYASHVIPLTKQGEILYLLNRGPTA